MNGFMALFRREWRRERALLFATVAVIAVLLPLFMVVAPIPSVADWPLHRRRMTPRGTLENWSKVDEWVAIVRFEAAIFVGMVSAVILPFLAAHSLAGERADRSAEFIAPLPVSRVSRLTAKIALLAAVASAIWMPIFAIAAYSRLPLAIPADERMLVVFSGAFTLLTTAIAWSLAAWIASPVFAAGMAIALTVAIPVLVFGVLPAAGVVPSLRQDFLALWMNPDGTLAPVTIGVAVVLFALGGIVELRRLE